MTIPIHLRPSKIIFLSTMVDGVVIMGIVRVQIHPEILIMMMEFLMKILGRTITLE